GARRGEAARAFRAHLVRVSIHAGPATGVPARPLRRARSAARNPRGLPPLERSRSDEADQLEAAEQILRRDRRDGRSRAARRARAATKEPKTRWTYRRDQEQIWEKTDLGFAMPFPTITGGIFEPGFPDILQQMWAAFIAERAGALGDRFGCATPDEAVASHEW